MEEDLICGLHAVLAALKSHASDIDCVWVSKERIDQRIGAVLDAASKMGVRVHKVPRAKLDRLVSDIPHQGVVARTRAANVRGSAELTQFLANLPVSPLLLILDGVQDPHNLGACLRSAAAAGAHGVIVPRDRSAPLTAAARRAASGAAEFLPVFQIVNVARTLEELKAAGIWLIGATQEAKTDIYQADLCRPLALLLGGEEAGLRRLTRESCDVLIRIPIVGPVESLNVSVAAGICLFETVRQRSTMRTLRG